MRGVRSILAPAGDMSDRDQARMKTGVPTGSCASRSIAAASRRRHPLEICPECGVVIVESGHGDVRSAEAVQRRGLDRQVDDRMPARVPERGIGAHEHDEGAAHGVGVELVPQAKSVETRSDVPPCQMSMKCARDAHVDDGVQRRELDILSTYPARHLRGIALRRHRLTPRQQHLDPVLLPLDDGHGRPAVDVLAEDLRYRLTQRVGEDGCRPVARRRRFAGEGGIRLIVDRHSGIDREDLRRRQGVEAVRGGVGGKSGRGGCGCGGRRGRGAGGRGHRPGRGGRRSGCCRLGRASEPPHAEPDHERDDGGPRDPRDPSRLPHPSIVGRAGVCRKQGCRESAPLSACAHASLASPPCRNIV